MTSHGRTVRPDLSEDQLIRLVVLTYGNRPRNWRWLTDWVTNENEYYGKGTVNFNIGGSRHQMKMTDTETIVRFYEDPGNWLDYTEEDMAAA